MLIQQGDCLEVLPTLPASSVDLVLTDLPYGSTACTWDTRLDLVKLWAAYQRVSKPTRVVVLTADLRFAVELMATAPKRWFRYELVWDKVATTGYLDANRRPLRRHELILVFSPKGHTTYNPAMVPGSPYVRRRSTPALTYNTHSVIDGRYGGTRFPTSVLAISNAKKRGKVHPTEKPVELLSYLIRTYSDPGSVVLDSCAGSGSTGEACLKEGREFIGIELDPTFFTIAKTRLDKYAASMNQAG